jgi:DHA3 family macrolide efflux protein-like MFS transporter
VRKFFTLWSSQAASLFGSAVVGFALAWYLAKETGSATILSTAMMVNFIPQIVLGPFIGPYIDRWNRKKIMIYGDLITALLTLVLVVLFYTDTIQIWHIYVVMAGRSTSGSFQRPALGASIPMIVPEKHLARANGLFMTLQGIINIVGPPTGAFLMEALEMQWVLSVDIITAIIAVGFLLPLAIPQPPRATLAIKFNVIGDMVQGFRYVASWRGLMFLVILAATLNFFAAPVNALLPLVVTKYLGADVLKLGWLQTAFGIGVITSGLILGVWGGFKRRIFTCLIGLMIWGISITAFGFITESLFFMGLALMLIAGFGLTMNNASVGAILQTTVARDIQGRVYSLVGSVSAAVVPIGLAIAGPLADAIGVRTMWYISGTAILILVTAGFFSRDLMNIENQKAAEMTLAESKGGV